VFNTLLEKCEQQNLFPDHRILHVNFEKAIITAANNVFLVQSYNYNCIQIKDELLQNGNNINENIMANET